jgi:diguanylate cyclase (GGDEF)-like protein
VTLLQQFTAIVVTAFALVFTGTVAFNVENTRVYLDQQLSSHAQDTATSLGLSLSAHVLKDDLPVVESMVDAIFDRGYYQEIVVSAVNGDALVNRTLNVHVEGVPEWFVGFLPLMTPRGDAEIMSGWKRGGRVSVRSHPGFAYRELWANAVDTFRWSVLTVLFAAGLTVILVRSLLRPLKAMEQQALAISERQFLQVEQLPGTRELRRVVLAMNKMSGKVRQMLAEQVNLAERMREQAYSDPVTGLANRRSFERRLQQMVTDREASTIGAVFLLAVDGLDEVNRERGFSAGDELLRAAAKTLTMVFDHGGFRSSVREHWLARSGGSEFGVLFPGAERDEAKALAAAICNELGPSALADVGLLGAHVGVAYFDGTQTPSDLMAEADMALRHAQGRGHSGWHLYDGDNVKGPLAPRGSQAWRTALSDIVSERKISLHFQSVKEANSGEEIHREVLARIPAENAENESNPWVPAGMFWPMATRLGFARALDQIVIDEVFACVRANLQSPCAGGDDVVYAVNLSPQSIADSRFVAWLLSELERSRTLAKHVVFEVAEYAAIGMLDTVRDLAARLAALGSGLAIDHFAAAARSFGYLQSVQLRYVKLDGGFVSALPSNADERFFVGALIDVAHGLDLRVIAEHVESREELDALIALNIDAVQGYLIGPPGPENR